MANPQSQMLVWSGSSSCRELRPQPMGPSLPPSLHSHISWGSHSTLLDKTNCPIKLVVLIPSNISSIKITINGWPCTIIPIKYPRDRNNNTFNGWFMLVCHHSPLVSISKNVFKKQLARFTHFESLGCPYNTQPPIPTYHIAGYILYSHKIYINIWFNHACTVTPLLHMWLVIKICPTQKSYNVNPGLINLSYFFWGGALNYQIKTRFGGYPYSIG